MDLLLDGIDFGDDFRGVRDKLIINMFYSTGNSSRRVDWATGCGCGYLYVCDEGYREA